MGIRVVTFALLCVGILGGIGFIFWQQEFRYSLPTPVPKHLKVVNTGDSVRLDFVASERRTYIHFYNYDCPCSRFNVKEFRSLVHDYADAVDFYAVLETDGLSADEVQKFKERYDLGVTVIEDPDGQIADALGVYSTPQAVIVDRGLVYYKGNYNKARFCLSRNTRFAERALYALVNNDPLPDFPQVAETPYGCSLPAHAAPATPTLFSNWSF